MASRSGCTSDELMSRSSGGAHTQFDRDAFWLRCEILTSVTTHSTALWLLCSSSPFCFARRSGLAACNILASEKVLVVAP